jgi:integrase
MGVRRPLSESLAPNGGPTSPRPARGLQRGALYRPHGRAVALALRDWLDHAYEQGDATARSVTHANADAPVWISLARNGSAGHALSLDAIADICFKRLGVSTVHSLRHTFARGMEDNGAKVSEIQARLGHESLETTGRYLARLTAGENRHLAGLARLYGMAPPAESEKNAGEADASGSGEDVDRAEAE